MQLVAVSGKEVYQFDLETMAESQLTCLPGPETLPRIHDRRVFFIAPDLIGQDSLFMIDLDEAGALGGSR
jgi:hypothetical protein